ANLSGEGFRTKTSVSPAWIRDAIHGSKSSSRGPSLDYTSQDTEKISIPLHALATKGRLRVSKQAVNRGSNHRISPSHTFASTIYRPRVVFLHRFCSRATLVLGAIQRNRLN